MIKKYFLLLLATLPFQFNGTAQEAAATVEQSIFNIQTGPIGIWASHEARLGNEWALRTEVGLDLWFYELYKEPYMLGGGTEKGSFLAPSISIEPRWYYNLQKRAGKGKHVSNNSANFLTLAVKFYPDLFKVGGPDEINVPNQLSFVPKWGIRRAIARSNFNYEVGIGIGYIWYISDVDNLKDASDVALDVHLRIGYTF